MSYPGGRTETFTYDADGNVLTRKTRANDTIVFTYDTLNRLSTKSPPSGPVVTYTYDLAGRPIGVGDTSTAIASAVSPTGSTVAYGMGYGYDALNRPTGVTWDPVTAASLPGAASSVSFSHSYSKTNQRVGQAANDNAWINYPAATPSTTSYTTNALNQYTNVGGVAASYDGNGNLRSDGTYTYNYDTENRLISVSGSGNTASYAYDALGRRKMRTVNGVSTVSVFDPDNREVLEYDETTGAVQRWYSYGLGPNDVVGQTSLPSDARVSFVPDIQGSIIGVLNVGSVGPTPFSYRPYGSSSTPATPFGFTGQRFDTESGLHYFRARHYSAAWGRFLQVDPSGYASSLNAYTYVSNDPLDFVDHTGEWQVTIGFFVGGGGVITVGENSGQWSIGGFLGLGFGGKIQVDPNVSHVLRPGLMTTGIGSVGIGINRAAAVEVSMTVPLGMIPSGRTYAPVEVEGSLQLFSYFAGGKVSVPDNGQPQLSPVQPAFGASAGGYGAIGATYRWGGDSTQSAGSGAGVPASSASSFGGSPASSVDSTPSSPMNQFYSPSPVGGK